MPFTSTAPGTPRGNASTLDAVKVTAIKAAAAAIVITMATDVTNGSFAAARAKAAQLEGLYGQLSAAKAP
jgi:hypothetical protein